MRINSKTRAAGIIRVAMVLAVAAGLHPVLAEEAKPPTPADKEVFLRGMIQTPRYRHIGVPKEQWDKDTYGLDTSVIFALDGGPDRNSPIATEFSKIIEECVPEKGLDAAAAEELKKQIDARVVYYIDAPPDVLKRITGPVFGPHILKGKVAIRDGEKWILIPDVSHIGDFGDKNEFKCPPFKYPAKYHRQHLPYTPFQPAGEPLTVKINDKIEVKFINLPPGKFMKGKPLWIPGYPEEQPSFVTLSKPFYMSETLVTQELYEDVMGEPVSNPKLREALSEKNPKLPVLGVDNSHRDKFFKLFSEKAGKKARLPTAAEWEYATRCGTSNPPWNEDTGSEYNCNDPSRKGYWHLPLPVKSKKPNLWGLYDFISPLWEIVGDNEPTPGPGLGSMDIVDTVDPFHPQPAGTPIDKRAHFAYNKFGYTVTSMGEVPENERKGEYAEMFRIVLEQETK